MTVKEYMGNLCAALAGAGIECFAHEAETIIQEALGKDRLYLYTCGADELSHEAYDACSALLEQRLSGRPLQYILGRASFMGLDFKVDERVLIPRQDTELLAEAAMDYLYARDAAGPNLNQLREDAEEDESRSSSKEKRALRALDLCTGSGALVCSLAAEYPAVEYTASDISPAALQLAEENFRALAPKARASFVLSDLFDAVPGRFDLIVSNPPYIPSDAIDDLQPEVRNHEPRLALDGGADGLDTVRRIIQLAPVHLNRGGLLLMEIGHDQGRQAVIEAEDLGAFSIIRLEQDLNGKDRMLVCQM